MGRDARGGVSMNALRIRCSGRWLFATLPQDLVLIWPVMNEIFNIKFPTIPELRRSTFYTLGGISITRLLQSSATTKTCAQVLSKYRCIASQPHALIYPHQTYGGTLPHTDRVELRLYQSLRCSSNIAPFRRPHPSGHQFFRSVPV